MRKVIYISLMLMAVASAKARTRDDLMQSIANDFTQSSTIVSKSATLDNQRFAYSKPEQTIYSEQPFLPTQKRIDREINKISFAYKGEVIGGVTASYGTLSRDNTDILLVMSNIDADGAITTIRPYAGYFYRDNRCIGVRLGYSYLSGSLDAANIDFGPSNDITAAIPYIGTESNNFSFGVFHRSYAGLDKKGRFGLFAEVELKGSMGTSLFEYEVGGERKITHSENVQLKFMFNPGVAVYIFPNVCGTLSFGLGGVKYSHVSQKDEDGNSVGSRSSSSMNFKLNIAAINIGLTIHLWDKKKR